jgi:hypothetical protein
MYTSQLKAMEVCSTFFSNEVCSTLNKIVTRIATRNTQDISMTVIYCFIIYSREKKNLFGDVTLTYGSRTRSAPASAPH